MREIERRQLKSKWHLIEREGVKLKYERKKKRNFKSK